MKNLYLRMYPILVASALFVSCAGTAHAHGAGISFSATSTAEGAPPYQVDVDFADLAIVEGSAGRFDFKLFQNDKREKSVKFTDVWVRVAKKEGGPRGQTLFAGPIANIPFGGAGFSIVFPEAGAYVMTVRYNDTSRDSMGEVVAEAEFTLDVRSAKKGFFDFERKCLVGAGALAALFVSALFLFARRKVS